MSHSYVEKNLKTNKNLKLNFEKNTLLTAVSTKIQQNGSRNITLWKTPTRKIPIHEASP